MAKPIRILVATPVAGGVITHDYMHGTAAFLSRCAELGWSTAHVTQPDGLVTRSRNSFASIVVRDPSTTHLLMLDADVVGRQTASSDSCAPLSASSRSLSTCWHPRANAIASSAMSTAPGTSIPSAPTGSGHPCGP